MKKCVALVVTMLAVLAFQAMAQTGTDSATTPAVTTPPPAPAPKPAEAAPLTSGASRYGSIMGGWLTPTGDFSDAAQGGWSIMLSGYQYINPMRNIAVGSDIGYESFGKKNGVGYSNFPVDAILKIFPKPPGKRRLFLQAGLGFNYTKAEIGNVSNTDYAFGTQAGGGLEIHGNGPVAITADAIYHWVFATGVDPNFLAVRVGLLVPLMPK